MSDEQWLTAHLATARPRVLAALVRYFRDLDRAEDAFQEACLRAVRRWPYQGLPRDPSAWLILAGRNAGIDALRRTAPIDANVDVAALPLAGGGEDDQIDALDRSRDRDDILRLMFMCCHPELPLHDQLALALKVIAGLSVTEIARAFLIQPKTLGQRLTRAKKKAASVGVKLDTPSLQARRERLEAVSLMIYLMFNEGYAATRGPHHIRIALCEEAIRLARLLVTLFPGQGESKGLLALCLLQHSRHAARIDAGGHLVGLEEQERRRWNTEMIAEANVLLDEALRGARPGPYQIQAAIAATHCAARSPAETNWAEIERLYLALEHLQPSPIIALNRAVAIAQLRGPAAALAVLDELEQELASYLPFQVTRAGLLAAAGRPADASQSYEAALQLEATEQERAFLKEKLQQLSDPAIEL